MSSRLFIELYLDEDVDVLVAQLLRARGYSAVTTQDAGLLGASDEEQLDFATSRQLALVTHNRAHFEEQIRQRFATGKHHGGIIIASRHEPQEIVRRLLIILDSTTADEMENQVRYI